MPSALASATKLATGWLRDWSLPRIDKADRMGTSICLYCAVGCAQLVYAKDNRILHIEGDPRSPINQGNALSQAGGDARLPAKPAARHDREVCVHHRGGEHPAAVFPLALLRR